MVGVLTEARHGRLFAIVAFATSRIDEVNALADHMRESKGAATGLVRRGTFTSDRDRPDHVSIIEFDSYDVAVANANYPDTAIARKGIVVGATVGFVPVPGVMPPPAILKRMPFFIANTRRMQQAGVRVVAGSDAGIAPVKPHDAIRYAVPQLLDLGMSSFEVLRTITVVAAEVCGLADTKGRIAAGYDADILAVGGDPLTEPESIHRIRAVYSRGRRVALVRRSPSTGIGATVDNGGQVQPPG